MREPKLLVAMTLELHYAYEVSTKAPYSRRAGSLSITIQVQWEEVNSRIVLNLVKLAHTQDTVCNPIGLLTKSSIHPYKP